MAVHQSRTSRHVLATLAIAASLASIDARADVVYSSIPTPEPVNYPSQPYEAQQVSEFGDHVTLSHGGSLQSVTLALSNFAYASAYPSFFATNSAGFTVPLTLNLYNYASNGQVGSVIATETINTFIAWRPEPNAAVCGAGGGDATRFVGSDGACHGGRPSDVSFDFSSSSVTVPSDLVFGLAFNTQDYGSAPTGTSGPYNSLNFALSSGNSVGTDVNPDEVFVRTTAQGTEAFFGGNTPGAFSATDGYRGFVPAASFAVDAAAVVPEPSTVSLFGIAIVGIVGIARRRKRG